MRKYKIGDSVVFHKKPKVDYRCYITTHNLQWSNTINRYLKKNGKIIRVIEDNNKIIYTIDFGDNNLFNYPDYCIMDKNEYRKFKLQRLL